jgi:hypothetical protein
MADITSIQPQAAASQVAAAPQEDLQQPTEPDINLLAPEVANLPVVQAVFMGQPAAVYATKADKDNPAVGLIAQAQQDLPAAGLGLFATDEVAVLFNPQFTSPQEVAEAARAGKIDSVAVPIGMLDEAFTQAQGEMEGAAPPMAAAGGSPVPAAGQTTQSRINAARAQNLKPAAPTKGARPGQGIVNDLTRKAF